MQDLLIRSFLPPTRHAGAATSLGAGEWLRRGLGALMLAGGAILTIEFLDPNVSAYAFTFG